MPNEPTIVMVTRDGYIKRLPPDTFRAQTRGGKGVAELDLYDLHGRKVRSLSRGSFAAGQQQVTWDGRDDAGRDPTPTPSCATGAPPSCTT